MTRVEHVATFALAGVGLRLRLPEAPFARELVEAWAPFQAAPAQVDELVVQLSTRPPTQAPPREFPDIVPEPDGFRVEGPDYRAHFLRSARRVVLEQPPSRFPVETLAKLVVADRIAQAGGVVLHGVGVATRGAAAVFVGVSGAGKSTLGSLWAEAGRLRLADELVAVVPVLGGYEARGTPWNVGAPGGAPLRLLGRLAWADAPALAPASAAECLRLLAGNALLVDDTPEGRARQFRALTALVSAVPPKTLAFSRDAATPRLLAEALGA